LDIDPRFEVGSTELMYFLDNPLLAEGQTRCRAQLPFRKHRLDDRARNSSEALGLLLVDGASDVKVMICGFLYFLTLVGSSLFVMLNIKHVVQDQLTGDLITVAFVLSFCLLGPVVLGMI
jgi:hypothetical protein